MSRRSFMHRLRRRWLSAGLLALVAAWPAMAQVNPLALAVKATYLYKFAPFVSWPATAFTAPDAPLVLCVVGQDPFGATLDEAVAGQRIGQRTIALRRLATADRQSGCHIMYVVGSAAQPVSAVLDAVRGSPVLTFTDEAIDAAARGVVHFVIRDGRVRFEIDAYAAAENSIVISSKVLSLALSVRPRR